MALDLTLACGEMDLTHALQTGEVSPQGVELSTLNYPSPERHWRMIKFQEFDLCEMSMGSYLASRQFGDEFPFTAIPVFPHRRFRHSYMFKPAGSDVTDPGDLDGARVGLKNWQNSAGIWMKGIAQEQYGLDLRDVSWYIDTTEEIPVSAPDAFEVDLVPEDTSVEEMLVAGELDAAFHPLLLNAVKDPDGGAERLFGDAKTEEETYYEETGLFPLMHTLVIRDDILDEHPWVAINVKDAFEEALAVCMSKLEDPRWTALAWARQHLEHQQRVLGTNPYEYGFTDGNLKALETMQRYAADQGVIPAPYDLDELFVESTLEEAERDRRVELGERIFELRGE